MHQRSSQQCSFIVCVTVKRALQHRLSLWDYKKSKEVPGSDSKPSKKEEVNEWVGRGGYFLNKILLKMKCITNLFIFYYIHPTLYIYIFIKDFTHDIQTGIREQLSFYTSCNFAEMETELKFPEYYQVIILFKILADSIWEMTLHTI